MRVLAAFVFLLSALYAQQTVTIGVLAHRGEAATQLAWQPTAAYLSEQIEGYRFDIMPLPFEGFDSALDQKVVDFIVLNSAFYIEMEYRHGVSRIATLQNRDARGESHTRFGSVIFTRHESPITRIAQLEDRRIAAVDPISLGGWLMALRQMRRAGIDEGGCEVAFEGTHDQVVYRVLAGQADAGVVRSDTLERMAAEDLIKLSDLRVLEPKTFEGFSFFTSTDLYPEWPFARARHTPTALAEKVAVALIRMPADHPAAHASQISGWTIPLDYQPVHDLMRDLEMGPYSELTPPTTWQLLKRYWPGVLLALITLFSLTYATLVRGRINRILSGRVAEKTRALQHSQDEIASIAESMGEGLLAFDPGGTLLLANPAAENILSLSPRAIQSHLKHASFVFSEIRTHLQNGQKGRYSGIWKHGEHARHLSLTIAPLSGPWGDKSGVVVVFGDTTEEHAAKERLEQLNRTLEAKVSEKIAEIRHKERLLSEQGKLVAMAEMMSAIAHHWRQPINNVAVLAQDLQEADRYSDIAKRSRHVTIMAAPDSSFAEHPTSQLPNVSRDGL